MVGVVGVQDVHDGIGVRHVSRSLKGSIDSLQQQGTCDPQVQGTFLSHVCWAVPCWQMQGHY